MAINKEGNAFTFGFAIVMVAVVGTILASLAMGLKPQKKKNEEVKKKMDILSAFLDLEKEGITRANAEESFKKYVDLKDAIVLDPNGKVKKGIKAFDVDIKKEYRDKNLDPKKKNYPLFIGKNKKKETVYIIPLVGKGLWGPIWGNICVGPDMQTIYGASFGHKTETPGLGAEISQEFFIKGWKKEKISYDSSTENSFEFRKFEVVKDGSGKDKWEKEGLSKVDGITGGTITSKGVEEMANRCLKVYVKYFKSLRK
ncbi:MAG: FMN-binding protein [Crocinitomicaceae bacterium]|nr:FMN-binding protein [Crocinitomicaceae bacterium]